MMPIIRSFNAFSIRSTSNKLIWLVILLVVLSLRALVSAQSAESIDERIQRATVYVMQANTVANNQFITCISSGTLVSRDGLILTNAHNTVPSADCPGDTIIISLNLDPAQAPVPKYRASIIGSDMGADIALLHITQELDGRKVIFNDLTLPFVELTDSTAVKLDDTITIAGFSGIGDQPVSLVKGTVTGFVQEPVAPSGSWIKTGAAIPGIMSGGGAYDRDGRLIGIPTTAPLLQSGSETICTPIQDTNEDGIIGTGDQCIPVGGFINALRPSNFARPLIRAASLSLVIENLSESFQSPQANTLAEPNISRLFFSTSVNESGLPNNVIRNLPAGSGSLYLFFDYTNFTPSTVFELRVTTDGRPNPVFSIAPVRWSGGNNGLWYIGSDSQVWPNGVYEFTLFADGKSSSTARLIIGVPVEVAPTFSDITFGLLDLKNDIVGNGNVLPSGGNTASAKFIYRNMPTGQSWTAIWYLNGSEIPNSRQTNTWVDGESGAATTSIKSGSALPPGSYRLELYIGDRLAATSDFIIAGIPQGARPTIFANARFTNAASPSEAIAAPTINNFSERIASLYMLFDWQQIAPGTLWKITWLVDNQPFYSRTGSWSSAQDGVNYLMRLSQASGLPDGTYAVELSLSNIPFVRIEAKVGIGQLPIDRLSEVTGVRLQGQVLDADTRLGLPGVTVIVISKDFSTGEFFACWCMEQVYALTITDADGNFVLNRPLEVSSDENTVAYSAVIIANGYLPLSADGLEVTEETPLPLNMVIYLNRD